MRLLGIEEARTRSEYVTTVLNQSVDAKGFEYPADLAVFCLNPTLSGCGSFSFPRSSDVRPVNASPDPASSARAITNARWKMF